MLIHKLKKQEDFSSSEKEVANYILEHPKEIINMSIREIAKETYSSPTTILRLCRKIGMNGFQEFRIAFNTEMSSEIFNSEVNEDIPFYDEDSITSIANNIATINIRGIQDTLSNFDFDLMNEIIKLFRKGAYIDIYGDGSSLLSASEFRLKMLRLGINVHIEENFSNQCYQAVNSNIHHVAILISHSGESLNVTKILKILKKQNTKCIAITSDKNSTIAKQSDFVIQNGSYENLYLTKKLEMYSSHTAVHFILDCLYSFYYINNYAENLKKSKEKETLIRMYSTDKNN